VTDRTYPKPDLRQGNAFDLIKEVPNGSIQLTVTSPPYNVGKAYERRVSLEKYLTAYGDFAQDLFAKTSDRGSVAWQVGNYIEAGEVFPLDIEFYRMFKEAGFQLRNRIIWHFDHGLHARRRLSGRYETILWFSKSDDYIFNLDPIRVPAKYPGKLAYKGDNKGQPTGNPLGKNPSDIWRNVVTEDWERGLWDIPNVKANHPEKTYHPCQFPVELVQRCVLALSRPGDQVLDPFLGVASSAIGSIMHDREFLGFELDSTYLEEARARIKSFEAGTLKLRPLGKPVHQPTGREKVATVPTAWLKPASDGADSDL
jgi:DNA modification methylase